MRTMSSTLFGSGPIIKDDWDNETAKEQGNAGEDTADSSGNGEGDDK